MANDISNYSYLIITKEMLFYQTNFAHVEMTLSLFYPSTCFSHFLEHPKREPLRYSAAVCVCSGYRTKQTFSFKRFTVATTCEEKRERTEFFDTSC